MSMPQTRPTSLLDPTYTRLLTVGVLTICLYAGYAGVLDKLIQTGPLVAGVLTLLSLLVLACWRMLGG